MKKMKLAVVFAALVSVFGFSSCLDSGGDSRQPNYLHVTVTGDEFLGYNLYADGGGILKPTITNMKQLGDWKNIKRATVGFYYLDDPLPEFSETTKYNVEVFGFQELFGGSDIIDLYNNEDADTLITNQDPISDLAISAYKGYITVAAQVNYTSSNPFYFNMGYDSSKDIDVSNETLKLTFYYDNGETPAYNAQPVVCSFPFPTNLYGEFTSDSLTVVVKAISDKAGDNYLEKKVKMSKNDFFPPRSY